jgi:hypothetical protein
MKIYYVTSYDKRNVVAVTENVQTPVLLKLRPFPLHVICNVLIFEQQ